MWLRETLDEPIGTRDGAAVTITSDPVGHSALDIGRWPDLAPPSRAPMRAAVARTLLRRVAARAAIRVALPDGTSFGPANAPTMRIHRPQDFFTRLGREIKDRSPFRHTFVAELANDWIGYLPDIEAHRLGGYQTWTGLHSYAEPGTGERVVEEVVKMLNELAKENAE